ncbi:MAG: hypothetical protein GXY82_03315 [Methanospirillum sp.]|nr:hypothetical protein [Methanospirillum sp.]
MPAFPGEERRQTGDGRAREEYRCGFVATADQGFTRDLVTGAVFDGGMPLCQVAGAGGRGSTGCRPGRRVRGEGETHSHPLPSALR